MRKVQAVVSVARLFQQRLAELSLGSLQESPCESGGDLSGFQSVHFLVCQKVFLADSGFEQQRLQPFGHIGFDDDLAVNQLGVEEDAMHPMFVVVPADHY